MTIYLIYSAFLSLSDKEDRCDGVLSLLLLPLQVALATPTYTIFIIVAGFVKLYKPVIKNGDELLGGWLSGFLVNKGAPLLRMFELVGESYPQALLGELALVFLCCYLLIFLYYKNMTGPHPLFKVFPYSILLIFLRSGLFIQIVLKTRESVMERTIQYVGIGTSIISIVKVRNSISQKCLQLLIAKIHNQWELCLLIRAAVTTGLDKAQRIMD